MLYYQLCKTFQSSVRLVSELGKVRLRGFLWESELWNSRQKNLGWYESFGMLGEVGLVSFGMLG